MTINEKMLPWHETTWKMLQKSRQIDRLPHALLFVGFSGLGKRFFSEKLAHSLLCSFPDEAGFPCESCRSCQLISAGNNPDLMTITPEEEGKSIKIDQIRELIGIIDKTPQMGGNKVVIIHPADSMNVNAANALLKTLEEPTPNTHIILVTHRLMMLPPTVRSRCQIIHFTEPSEEVALEWLVSKSEKVIEANQLKSLLALAKRAPFLVLNMIENDEMEFRKEIFKDWINLMKNEISIVSVAKKWIEKDSNNILLHFLSWVRDIIRVKYVGEEKFLINRDIITVLNNIANRCDSKRLFLFLDELQRAHHWLNSQSNLNQQLLIESVLMQWLEVISV